VVLQDSEADDTPGTLEAPSEIWKLVERPKVLIEADSGESEHVRFQVSWEAEFDDDGVGVWLSNFEFELIGGTDDR